MVSLPLLAMASLLVVETTIILLLLKTRRDVLERVDHGIQALNGEVAAQFQATREEIPGAIVEYMEQTVVKRAHSIIGKKGAEARQDQAAEAEVEAAEVEAGLIAELGVEVVDMIKHHVPDIWDKAMDHPRLANRILGPIIAKAQAQMAQMQEQVGNGQAASGDTPW